MNGKCFCRALCILPATLLMPMTSIAERGLWHA